MGDYGRNQLDFDEEDRLPWLEPATEEDEKQSLSPLRLLGLLLVVLAIIGAAAGGLWWYENRGGSVDGREGALIAAPEGNYKVAATEADSKKFEGEGDASFAASEGVAREGRIDPSRVPEAPITGTRPAPTGKPGDGPAKPSQSVNTRVEDETKATPQQALPARTASGVIQLGAYGNQAVAKEAWTKLSKRFAYLAPLAMTIEAAQVGGGTVYRLRASAGDQASTVCGRLKVAGESCIVIN